MITEATQLWRILFSRFCCSINRQSPHLHKNAIQDISFYVNLWVTRRCYVHHYRLREAGCLINLLETSVPLIRMTQPRDMRALFSVIFLITSLGLGLRSRFRGQRTVLDRMLMVVFALSTQHCASSLQLKSMSARDQWPHLFDQSDVVTAIRSVLDAVDYLPPPQDHCVKYTLISYRPENTLTLAIL